MSDQTLYPTGIPWNSPPAGRRRVPVPEQVRRVYVPRAVLHATSTVMRRFGEEGRECYVWWGGSHTADGHAYVTTAYCPDVPSSFGRVHVGREKLGELHEALRENDQVLVAELHTHPPGAGDQNEVDAANAAATYPGFLSLVIPNFAVPYLFDLRQVHTYEYESEGHWRTLDPAEIEARFTIEPTMLTV